MEEKYLNTTAYSLIIVAEIIYIYVTLNDDNITVEDKSYLVHLGRTILFITAIYFVINAFVCYIFFMIYEHFLKS